MGGALLGGGLLGGDFLGAASAGAMADSVRPTTAEQQQRYTRGRAAIELRDGTVAALVWWYTSALGMSPKAVASIPSSKTKAPETCKDPARQRTAGASEKRAQVQSMSDMQPGRDWGHNEEDDRV